MKKFVTTFAMVMAGTLIGANAEAAMSTTSTSGWMPSHPVAARMQMMKDSMALAERDSSAMHEAITLCSLPSGGVEQSSGQSAEAKGASVASGREDSRLQLAVRGSDVVRLRLPAGIGRVPRYLLIEGAQGSCHLYRIVIEDVIDGQQ